MGVNIDLTKYGKSSSSLKKKWMDELTRLLEVEEHDKSPSNLQGGIIGYSFDVMSNIIEDAYFESNEKAKEVFVSEAKFTHSIYLHAFTNGVIDIYAKPASIEVLIGIRIKDILEKAIERRNLGYRQLTINSDAKIYLTTYEYILDYPIDIIVKTVNGKNTVSAKYNIEKRNLFSDVETTFISSMVQNVNGEDFLVFKTTARQLVKSVSNYVIGQNKTLTDEFVEEWSDQLAGFRVLYKEPNKDPVELEAVYKDTVITKVIGKFCYFQLTDNQLTISFSSHPDHFYPIYNSNIFIEKYTTLGVNGNFSYSSNGAITIALTQNPNNLYESSVIGSYIAIQLASIESYGGYNMKDRENIRQEIIEMKTCRKTLISELDLNREFEKEGLKFRKVKDDIERREFGTYLLLQDPDSSYIIPSRTGEIRLYKEQLERSDLVGAHFVKTDSVFVLWLNEEEEHHNYHTYKMLDFIDGVDINTVLANNDYKRLYSAYENYNGMVMRSPFVIKIFDQGFIGIYDVYSEQYLTTVFEYNNPDSPEKFYIPSIKVERKDIYSKQYKISTAISVSSFILESLQYTAIEDLPFKVKLEMLDNYSKPHCYIHLDQIEMSEDGTRLIAYTYLPTDDILHNDDYIYIKGHKIRPLDDDDFIDTVPESYRIPFKSKLRVNIAYNPENGTILPNQEYKQYLLSQAEVDEGFVITDSFIINGYCEFVKDVSKVFSMNMEVVKNDPIWPKYNNDVYTVYTEPVFQLDDNGEIVTYDTPVYQLDENGDIVMDENGDPILLHSVGDPIILHEIGDIIMTETSDIDPDTGLPIMIPSILHNAGDNIISYDNNNRPVYKTPPKYEYRVKNLPLVSLISLLYDDHREKIYKTFNYYISKIQNAILPRLLQNNRITMSVYNTIGESELYLRGYKNFFTKLDRLDINIELNVKLKNNDTADMVVEDIKKNLQSKIVTTVNRGFLYVINTLTDVQRELEDFIEYLEFVSINKYDSSVQTVKLDPNIDNSDLIPEFVTIAYKLDRSAFENENKIILTPDITVNIL